jgi:hypothetical protein
VRGTQLTKLQKGLQDAKDRLAKLRWRETARASLDRTTHLEQPGTLNPDDLFSNSLRSRTLKTLLSKQSCGS